MIMENRIKKDKRVFKVGWSRNCFLEVCVCARVCVQFRMKERRVHRPKDSDWSTALQKKQGSRAWEISNKSHKDTMKCYHGVVDLWEAASIQHNLHVQKRLWLLCRVWTSWGTRVEPVRRLPGVVEEDVPVACTREQEKAAEATTGWMIPKDSQFKLLKCSGTFRRWVLEGSWVTGTCTGRGHSGHRSLFLSLLSPPDSPFVLLVGFPYAPHRPQSNRVDQLETMTQNKAFPL